MKRRKRQADSIGPLSHVSAVRVTISFPSDLYEILEKLARKKKVSLAWVVRAATEKYVAEQPVAGPNEGIEL